MKTTNSNKQMNNLTTGTNNDIMSKYQKTDDIISDVKYIIDASQNKPIMQSIRFYRRETG